MVRYFKNTVSLLHNKLILLQFIDKMLQKKYLAICIFCMYYNFKVACTKLNEKYIINVDLTNDIKYVEHFWESTGLCPPEPYQNASKFLLSPDMKINLALIGSLPRQHLFQVRIHWLLNLVKVRSFENKTVIYDFQDLDNLIVALKKNYLRPGFELMGNPSGIFTNFENRTQIFQWRDLVKTLAKHYIDKFGFDYVSQWNFESWNEPDHKDFDGLNFTLQGYLNYYDACSEGLKLASPLLKLGGPAESFRGKFINFSYHLLEHCSSGINYFTGELGVRLDYISMHKKGNLTSISILDEELETIEELITKFPKFKNTPIYNDEADPLVGWWKSENWRSDNHYAAMIIKVISQHLELVLLKKNNSINYTLLSNDNGFLNTIPQLFTQRTLLTRFANSKNTTVASNIIRKPVFIATGLLNYLGEQYVSVEIKGSNKIFNNSYIGAIAAYHKPISNDIRDSLDFGLIIYNSDDMNSSNVNLDLSIRVKIFNFSDVRSLMWVGYKLDNTLTNPYQIWQQMGQPLLPDALQLEKMRNHEGPFRTGKPRSIKPVNKIYTIRQKLSQPGILVLHACVKPLSPPGKVTNIQIHAALNNDCLITWNIPKLITKCIRTFDIQFSSNRTGSFIKINNQDIIFNSFWINTRDKSTRNGYYRIRATDYWNRSGVWSTTFGRCN